jgi:glycerol-3-phosphate dehydrogenase
MAESDPALAEPLAPGLPYVGAELVYAVEHEMACTLADLLVRRTYLAFESGDGGVGAAPRAAALVAPLLGWDEAARHAEVERYRGEARRLFSVDAAEP